MPDGTNFSQQFQESTEHRDKPRVGDEQTMQAQAVERFVARDRGGSTDIRVELGPLPSRAPPHRSQMRAPTKLARLT